MKKNDKAQVMDIHLGKYEVFFKQIYTILYNLNDVLIGLWFLIGSICFFWESTKTAGVWLFVLGSAQLLIRPLIRIIHRIHFQKYVKNNQNEGESNS
ncbi:YrhK family protein [Pontibacillus marinus]|uniref:YrhK domain-containing protein n=1 Tax=Pontibacillus marinus BH030004 = DSM 16465 TaxID=1385511 RepID=A0A0A5FZA8_9BACI|nr:YrhK family protein [Pontibacillus marinus]KGX84178.1 hypothetical protein N783_18720 [Pontibacillus marinus BH030004 = DSM 16465]